MINLKNSLIVSNELDGCFDPTIGPLSTLSDIPNQVGKDESEISVLNKK